MPWAEIDYFIFAITAFTLGIVSATLIAVFIKHKIRLALALGLLDLMWAIENTYWFLTFHVNYPIINYKFPPFGLIVCSISLWTLYELYRRHFKV
jgi:hypothetical protein